MTLTATALTRITIIRHGEVQGGMVFRGSQDDPLSERGWQQMASRLELEGADHYAQTPYDRVISSPLKRCSEFAKDYSKKHNIPLKKMRSVQEIHFGDWEGKSYAQIRNKDPEALKRFYQDPCEFPPPKGEALDKFQRRIIKAIRKITRKYQGYSILLVCHGGVQKMILAHALQMPLSAIHTISTAHASLSVLNYYEENGKPYWVLERHG